MLACRAGDDDDGTVDWEPARANRRVWDRISSWYQETHDPQIGRQPKLWGAWSVPESELGALGPTVGLRGLELGCGGAQWGAALAAEGAVVVGLDLSGGQLQAAQARAPDLPLVHGAAESLPFRSETFDFVFCDHGALSWSDPTYSVSEATRVLVPGGRLVLTPPVRGCASAMKAPPTVLRPACTISILTLEPSTREMAPGLIPSPTAHGSGSFAPMGS